MTQEKKRRNILRIVKEKIDINKGDERKENRNAM